MPVVAHFEWWTNLAIILMAAANILLFAGLVVLAFKLKSIVTGAVDQALEAALPKIQPVLDNVSHVTGQVSDIVDKVAPRVEHIAADSEDTVHNVTAKVKTTSSIVTENVAKPIVNIASLLTGVQRGLEVWKTAKTHHDSDGDHGAEADGMAANGNSRMADRDGRAVPPETAAHS